jgi:hypothetical protein
MWLRDCQGCDEEPVCYVGGSAQSAQTRPRVRCQLGAQHDQAHRMTARRQRLCSAECREMAARWGRVPRPSHSDRPGAAARRAVCLRAGASWEAAAVARVPLSLRGAWGGALATKSPRENGCSAGLQGNRRGGGAEVCAWGMLVGSGCNKKTESAHRQDLQRRIGGQGGDLDAAGRQQRRPPWLLAPHQHGRPLPRGQLVVRPQRPRPAGGERGRWCGKQPLVEKTAP